MIVEESGSPNKNKPHYTSRVFCETKVRNYQHKTEETNDHYPQEDNAYSGLTRYFIQIFGGFYPIPKIYFKNVSTDFRARNIAFVKG